MNADSSMVEREKHNAYMREYMRKWRAKEKAAGRIYWKTYRSGLKSKCREVLGGPICANCGCTDSKILEINHINGGGRKHLKVMSNDAAFYRFVLKNPEMFNVLCRVCNALHYVQDILGIKGFEIKWSQI